MDQGSVRGACSPKTNLALGTDASSQSPLRASLSSLIRPRPALTLTGPALNGVTPPAPGESGEGLHLALHCRPFTGRIT